MVLGMTRRNTCPPYLMLVVSCHIQEANCRTCGLVKPIQSLGHSSIPILSCRLSFCQICTSASHLDDHFVNLIRVKRTSFNRIRKDLFYNVYVHSVLRLSCVHREVNRFRTPT